MQHDLDHAYNLAALMCLMMMFAPFVFEAVLHTIRFFWNRRKQRTTFRALDRRVNL